MNPQNGARERWWQRFRRFLMGDDIFVSYSRKDGMNYAPALAAQLTKRGFLCFIDLLGSDPNEKVPDTLKEKVRRSTVFVLIGTQAAANSTAVAEEVAEFVTTRRPIIPIDINGALVGAAFEHLIQGLARTDEIDGAVPSEAVLTRIENSFKYSRRNQTLRRVFIWTAACIVGLIVVGAMVTSVMARRTAEANMQRSVAEVKTQAALERSNEANRMAASAEDRQHVAEASRREAEILAERARGEAVKQQRIANAQRLTGEAELVLKQQPDQLPRSLLLASQSLQEFDALGMRSLDADLALREALKLMPRLVRTVDLQKYSWDALAFSGDGQYLAMAKEKSVRVLDTTGPSTIEMAVDYPTTGTVFVHLKFSPNRKYLATVHYERQTSNLYIQVWEVATGKAVAPSLKRHATEAFGLDFSADEQYIALSDDEGAHVYEVAGMREATPALRSKSRVYTLVFSPDGKYLATTGNDEFVRVWEWRKQNDKPVALLEHEERPETIMFESSGRYLAVACFNYTVRIWDWAADTRRPVAPPMKFASHIVSMAFSPKGKYVAASSEDGVVRVLEVAKPNAFELIDSEEQPNGLSKGGSDETFRVRLGEITESIAFSPDERYLATGSRDKTARVWEIASGREIARAPSDSNVSYVLFRPGGHRLVTMSGKVLREWDANGDQPSVRGEHPDAISAIAFSPDGRYFATGSFKRDFPGHAYVWELDSGHQVTHLEFVTTNDTERSAISIRDLVFSPDGRYLVIATEQSSNQSEICAWIDWNTPKPRKAACIGLGTGMYKIAMSDDGRYLAAGTDDGFARVWSNWFTPTPQQLGAIKHEHFQVLEVAFSREGNYLATVSGDMARVWDWRKGGSQPVAAIKDQGFPRSVVFSSDSRYLTTIADDVALIWDWKSNSSQPVAGLRHDGSRVLTVSTTPDRRYVVTSGEDQTIRVWDAWGAAVPREIARIHSDARFYQGTIQIGLSGDGRYIGVAPTSDNRVQLWLWRPKDSVAAACAVLKAAFSESAKLQRADGFNHTCEQSH